MTLIRIFALVCAAVSSVFVMGMIVWMTILLSDTDWCTRVVGATPELETAKIAFGGCFGLLTQQMHALATNSFIFAGVIALCLATLVVIVVADARLSFSANSSGASANLSGSGDTPPPNTTIQTTTTTAISTDDTPPPMPDTKV